jgi:hypothetical protein
MDYGCSETLWIKKYYKAVARYQTFGQAGKGEDREGKVWSG